MGVLNLLATAVLTNDGAIDSQPSKSLMTRKNYVQELSLLTSEPLAQIHPVHQLDSQLNSQISNGQSVTDQAISEQLRFDQDELQNHVNVLETQVDSLETRVFALEAQQFSPTAFLAGEVILAVSGASGRDFDDSIVFQSSAELIFNVSFTGEDLLAVGFEGGQAEDFSFIEDITFEGRLDSPSDTDGGRLELSELNYEFSVGDRASVYISATGDDIEDFNPILGDDVLSEFGTENPIHSLLGDFGLQFNYELADSLELGLGYFSEDGSDPETGLFNGNYGTFAQLGFEPSDSFLLGLTYIYTNNDSSLATETGSMRSQLDLERPVIGNSYGVSASFLPSDRIAIGGWAGLTNARVLGLGDANVWNYAFTLGFPDFGQEGNLLGLIIGQEPRLTGTSGFTIDERRRDPDTSLHVEVFYTNQVSDNLSVTPGLIWITAPNHDRTNADIIVFAVRTKFEF